jgi:hypothetical protein
MFDQAAQLNQQLANARNAAESAWASEKLRLELQPG